MDIIKELQQELKEEFDITKKFIAIYPEDKNDWKPHEKSGSMLWTAIHVVEIFEWPATIMTTEFLDFAANPYTQPDLSTRAELMEKLNKDYAAGLGALKELTPASLEGTWEIRLGDVVFAKWSKYGAIRHSLNQITHHRAQLGVFYRLNDIHVPGSYGPSGDEQ